MERDAVLPGEHRDGVGPDLVGGIAVGGDAIGADDDPLHATFLHHLAGRVVADERHVHAGLHEFPRRQARALKERSGLVGEDVETLSPFVRDEYRGERSPVARGGQRAGVAVREDAVAVGQELRAVLSDGAAHAHVLVANGERLVQKPPLQIGRRQGAILPGHLDHPVQRPGQVDGRGPGRGEKVRDGPQFPHEFLPARCGGVADPEHGAHGRRDADRRGASHAQLPDRLFHLFRLAALDRADLGGKQRLVHDPQAAAQFPDPFDSGVLHDASFRELMSRASTGRLYA